MGLKEDIWKELLPHALVLIDEIKEHGGISDPFFTFGGGTVLMLRYNHRFSKDIDIFVPDPQSLGYVNPRLSDVADTICNNQYTEAENFVKLQLDAGEIDFVASPNLLPKEAAYQVWPLLGREVRVETAAEIVAKKMYHRGDKATARDVYDLAFVIEHEPAALKAAEPFFFRHLEVFCQRIDKPHQNFINQFNQIDVIKYQPTFEHAAAVASGYLRSLQRNKEQSLEAAEVFLKQNQLEKCVLDMKSGLYVGTILHVTDSHLVQSTGRGFAVIHDLHDFKGLDTTCLQVGNSPELSYKKGASKITNKAIEPKGQEI